MAHKQAYHTDQNVIEKARGFWENYSKPISYVGAAIIVVIAGWMIYTYMILEPNVKKANNEVYVTQRYFSQFVSSTDDSAKLMLATKVLNGDGAHPGALRIISKYSRTAAGNLCQYYAGACYLAIGQYDKALSHLKSFDADGATQIGSRAFGMMGDASAELKKNDNALDYYTKAANVNTKDDFTSSEYLFRAALFAHAIGKDKEAIKLFKKLKENYPMTEKASNADRYLARLGVFTEK